MSLCRQICRKAFRGCLQIPGCKPICYRCLRPVCSGVSDSEDDDYDSDKDDDRFYGNSRPSFPADIPLEDRTNTTETAAVVEYYNDISVLGLHTSRPDHESLGHSSDYNNTLCTEDPQASENMYTKGDNKLASPQDYVNMGPAGDNDILLSSTTVKPNGISNTHHYQNIDQVNIPRNLDVVPTSEHNVPLLQQVENSSLNQTKRCEDIEYSSLGDNDSLLGTRHDAEIPSGDVTSPLKQDGSNCEKMGSVLLDDSNDNCIESCDKLQTLIMLETDL